MRIKKKIVNTKDNQYYMYGKHAVCSAIKNAERKIIKLYCTNNFISSTPDFNLQKDAQIVDNNFINTKLKADVPHQGVIALVESVYKYDISQINFSLAKNRVVILDQITDPQNIGTIIRSAAAFGFNTIIMPKDNTPGEGATIAKAACGCLELVKVIKVTNLKQAINKLKDNGFWIAGMDARGDSDLSQLQTIEKIAVVIGSEGKGMRKTTIEACDYKVSIPISTKVESLNAASTASIIFHLLNGL